MVRLVTGRPGTIRLTIYDEDGVATDPASVSVVVKDGAGTTVSTGSATNSPIAVGVWTYTIPTSVTVDLDTYEVTWTYTLNSVSQSSSTTFEVCGGHLCEIAEIRAYDPVLDDDAVYTAEMIKQARVDAEQRFENGAQRAFTTRAARVSIETDGRERIVLPHCDIIELVAVDLDGDSLDPTDFTVHSEKGVIEYPETISAGSQMDLYYTYGLEVTPEPVRRAIKILAVEYLIPSGLPARATSQSTDLGEFRISHAGKDGTTGIPEVDSVMMDFGLRRPAIG